MKLFKISILLVSSLVSNMALALDNACSFSPNSINVGYLMTNSQILLLGRKSQLPRNAKTSTAEKIQRVEKSIIKSWKAEQIPGATAAGLAQLIVQVSESVGVDYQMLAAVIHKESNYCMFRFNKKGGDSGCMQFTNPALKEMKHQFGQAGEDKHSPGVPEVLYLLANQYFTTQSKNTLNEFKKWWSLDIDRMKQSLRGNGNFDFDILSGGLFLKFNLSLANGNYGTAVRNYNGSKQKNAYQASVTDFASKVSWDDINILCEEEMDFLNEVMHNSCELTEDANSCYSEYLRSLPNSI